MTIFPQPPYLVPTSKEGIMELAEPHLTVVEVGFGFWLVVLLKAGYKTDGASVPEEKLKDSKIVKRLCKIIAKHYPGKNYKEMLDYLIGTPFEMPRILAAIVHDGLYDIKWKIRWLCDRMYNAILSACEYDRVRQDIEYSGIRLFGRKNWNDVKSKHKKKMKDFVIANLVRHDKAECLKRKYIIEFG